MAALVVATTVIVLAFGALGSDDSGWVCTSSPSPGTPLPTATGIPDDGPTGLDAPARQDGCGTAEPPASMSPSPSASPSVAATVELKAHDLFFDPSEVTLAAADGVRIVLTNAGFVVHNLTIDELGVELVAARGRTDEVTLDDVTAGTYVFYCSVSGHREAGMEGTLTVG